MSDLMSVDAAKIRPIQMKDFTEAFQVVETGWKCDCSAHRR
mgnify:FL=1